MTFATEVFRESIQPFELEPDVVYTIDTAAHLAGVPRRTILIYCKHRLISPIVDPAWGGYYFDEEAIRRLRYIQTLRAVCGDDLAGIRMILRLMKEVEQLRAAVRNYEEHTW